MQIEHPAISVILTSFNHGKFIREAIDSVLNQSFQDFELIIFDDASEDDSWEIIKSYTDTRIRAYRNKKNIGPTDGVNKSIFELARGNYIAIHHSDDIWTLDKLKIQIDFLEAHQNIGAVFSNVSVIDERGHAFFDKDHIVCSVFKQPNRTSAEWLRHFFLNGNSLCHPSALVRKHCYNEIGGYDVLLWQMPDFDFWIRLCSKFEIHILSEALVKFRVLDNEMNTSGNRPKGRNRARLENYLIYERLEFVIIDFGIFKLFPEFDYCNRGFDTDFQFVFAKICLELEPNFQRRLYGIRRLFAIMSDNHRRASIEAVYGFSQRSFIELTGEYDIFSREEVYYLEREVLLRDEMIRTRDESVRIRDEEVVKLINRYKKFDGLIDVINKPPFYSIAKFCFVLAKRIKRMF